MKRIASTLELQAELTKLIKYAQTQHPSRVKLAQELRSLSVRLAGEIPEAFKENIEKMKAKGEKKDDDGDDDSDDE